jgi:uncharacterized protein (PEP-CTERM system associated)
LAAGASVVALSVASVAAAQPLANPVRPQPAVKAAAPGDAQPTNFLRPRVGVQAAVTDNVALTSGNKQSDVIGRATVGLEGRYDGPRTKANLSGDVVYDAYSKSKKYDSLTYRGTADAAFVVVPEVLAIEAAGARTQGSVTTFGSTDFFRSANATDYQVGTYYVGPHLTVSPGIFDLSAAARYGQVFYDGPKSPTAIQSLAPETSIYQVIGAADTGANLGRVRFVASAQYEKDDQAFESTAGSVSGFYQVTPRFSGIVRAGYDDMSLTSLLDLSAPFWSVGGQYVFNDTANIRLEGGRRYDAAYWSGSATLRVARPVYLMADYSNTLSPGPIQINNVLVDYVGGLDTPLPIPVIPPSFGLNSNFLNLPSINRTGSLRALVDLGRQSLDYTLSSTQQKYVGVSAENLTLSHSVTYTNLVRPDLQLSLRFLYASERLNGQILPGTGDREGSYYLTEGKIEYRLNSRTTANLNYQNRHFRPAAATLLQRYNENIGSISLVRTF